MEINYNMRLNYLLSASMHAVVSRSRTQGVNGCQDDALFNAVPNVVTEYRADIK